MTRRGRGDGPVGAVDGRCGVTAYGEWVVYCRNGDAGRAVRKAARATGCACDYRSRARMREDIDASDRRAGIEPTPRAILQGTREQMAAFYAAIPDDITGVEGYEWVAK